MNIDDPLNIAQTREEDGGVESSSAPHETGQLHVAEAYRGLIAEFEVTGADAPRVLSGSEGFIGAPLELVIEHDAEGEGAVSVRSSTSHTPLGHLPQREGGIVAKLDEQGWRIGARLSLVSCTAERSRFFAEVTLICHDPSAEGLSRVIGEFERRLAKRIAAGEHPSPSLDQQMFEELLASEGAWCATPVIRKRRANAGEQLVYRRRQTWSDRLVAYGLEHRMGCSALSTVFLVGVAALIVWLIFGR